MKRSLFILTIGLIAFGLIVIQGCKKSSEVSTPGFGNIAINGFTVELSTTTPKIAYKLNLQISETGGVGVTINSVTFSLYRNGFIQGTISLTGTQLFGTSGISPNGTLTATGFGLTYDGTQIATSAEIQISARDSENHSITKTATTEVSGSDALPKIKQFTAGSTYVDPGEQTALHWKVEDATSVTISRNGVKIADVDLQGSMFVTPSDSGNDTNRYKLTASNDIGSIFDDSVVIRVRYPAVEYRVSGSARRVNLTYENDSGGTSQQARVLLPWTYTFSSASSGDFLYISAQNDTWNGCVVVEIYKNGKLYKKSESCGAFVIATASGTY